MLKEYQYLMDAVKSGFLNVGTNRLRAFVEKTKEKIHTLDVRMLPTGYDNQFSGYMAILVKGHKKREVLWVRLPEGDLFCEKETSFCKKNRFILSGLNKKQMQAKLLKKVKYQVNHNYHEWSNNGVPLSDGGEMVPVSWPPKSKMVPVVLPEVKK